MQAVVGNSDEQINSNLPKKYLACFFAVDTFKVQFIEAGKTLYRQRLVVGNVWL